MVHAETRLKYPMLRKPGSDKFEQISWDVALDRIGRLMKDDRDKNFVVRNAELTKPSFNVVMFGAPSDH